MYTVVLKYRCRGRREAVDHEHHWRWRNEEHKKVNFSFEAKFYSCREIRRFVSLQAFGEKGIHARSAVGMSSMPLDIPVELEAIVEVV